MRVIVAGNTSGRILKANNPINFLGAIKKETSMVQDSNHDLFGQKIAGSILVFPHGVGSSVGAYTIYALKTNGVAPAAMICQKADLTVASGCAMANIPLIMVDKEYENFKNGLTVSIDTKTDSVVSFD